MKKNSNSPTSSTRNIPESEIKKEIREMLERAGWLVYYLVLSNKAGIPDMVANGVNGRAVYIETKTYKGIVRKLQQFRIRQLRRKGFEVIVAREPSAAAHLIAA